MTKRKYTKRKYRLHYVVDFGIIYYRKMTVARLIVHDPMYLLDCMQKFNIELASDAIAILASLLEQYFKTTLKKEIEKRENNSYGKQCKPSNI